MRKKHGFAWLTLLFLLATIATPGAIAPADAQDAPTCETVLEQAKTLLDQRQTALTDGNSFLTLSLMQQARDTLAPCADETTGSGLYAADSIPDWTPVEQAVDGVSMVQVPGGCFLMGNAQGEDNEQPVHEICFSLPYWIDKTEVTRGMYADCVAAGDCEPAQDVDNATRDTQPVSRVTWFQAEAYCEWRGLALPTEAEWEYAARGPKGLYFPWGNVFVPENAVYGRNSDGAPADVGTLPAGGSWVGALDMSGNVAEWVRTAYQPYPYTLVLGTVDQDRVVRGGSYTHSLSDNLRASARGSYAPTFELNAIGFRCVDSDVVRPAPDDSCAVHYQKAQTLLKHEADALDQGRTAYALQLIDDARDLLEPCASNDQWEPVTQQRNQTEMVEVPAGCFVMGREDGPSNERPAHSVCIADSFWLDKTEVTRSMYADCVAAGVCTDTPASASSQRGNQPQNNVTWLQARDYCEWRGARLPTEAEWEYAARGPDGWLYPWGDIFGVRQAVYNNETDGTEAVGSRRDGTSWVGALDMSGNVGEWVSSIYRPYPYAADDEREDAEDTSSPRVWRGGSFLDSDTDGLMSVTRQRFSPDQANERHGFRCAQSDSD